MRPANGPEREMAVARREGDKLTVSKPLSIILHDGSTAEGTLWMHPSCSGGFEVEYKGMRKTDHRTDYANEGQMRLIAVFILKELFDAEQRRIARKKRGSGG
jgi:hypothetical protein